MKLSQKWKGLIFWDIPETKLLHLVWKEGECIRAIVPKTATENLKAIKSTNRTKQEAKRLRIDQPLLHGSGLEQYVTAPCSSSKYISGQLTYSKIRSLVKQETIRSRNHEQF